MSIHALVLPIFIQQTGLSCCHGPLAHDALDFFCRISREILLDAIALDTWPLTCISGMIVSLG